MNLNSQVAQERAQILYEISMAIGTTLNLEEMLKTSISTIIRKLNCSVGLVYSKQEDRGIELITSIPKRIPLKSLYLEIAEELINSGSNFKEQENNFYYLFKLLNYGYFLIVKRDRELDEFILRSLEPIFLKLSSAIQACLSTEDLNKRIETEVFKNREKDAIMFQQARLASIGEMIGNIAHQWRQPLNSLGIIIQDVLEANEYGEVDDEYLQECVNEAMLKIDFMSQTIDDFRNFFKPNKSRAEFDVLSKIHSSISLIIDGIKNYNIDLKLENKETFNIMGYPNEFSQVIINIINNARDVLMSKENEKWISINISSKSRTILIEDSGGGIPKDIINKVFEPYFTTKHQSSGTGIGLYMSKMIVEDNMMGKLSVNNSENGAIFKIEFPHTS